MQEAPPNFVLTFDIKGHSKIFIRDSINVKVISIFHPYSKEKNEKKKKMGKTVEPFRRGFFFSCRFFLLMSINIIYIEVGQIESRIG